MRSGLLTRLGGEEGCRRLSAEFYGRVAKDAALRGLFPGKSLRCATEEFAAFLIQFLGGEEEQTQHRWWLSLRESHDRFRIGARERSAWLKLMATTIESAALDEETRRALGQFFRESSAYVIGADVGEPEDEELAARWKAQRELDAAVAAIAAGCDGEAMELAARSASRPSVFVGLSARMMQSGRGRLIGFVLDSLEKNPALAARRFAGRTLLHFACGCGCVPVVEALLRSGGEPDPLDGGNHTPLYGVANECAGEAGPEVVRMLVRAGADVNACAGVTRATPLHMAARRGHTAIAGALLDCGAAIDAKDRKGVTPLQRAIHCRRGEVARLLVERGAKAT